MIEKWRLVIHLRNSENVYLVGFKTKPDAYQAARELLDGGWIELENQLIPTHDVKRIVIEDDRPLMMSAR